MVVWPLPLLLLCAVVLPCASGLLVTTTAGLSECIPSALPTPFATLASAWLTVVPISDTPSRTDCPGWCTVPSEPVTVTGAWDVTGW